LRPGWVGRPYDKYWTGYGVNGWGRYGMNWYYPGYNRWYYPGYTYRIPYYYSNPTTYIDLTITGFSGGFDGMGPMLPTGNSLLNLFQLPVVLLPE
jgi:hypothetical protein